MVKNWTIYKITSPTGRVYIGRTSNYIKRMYNYKSLPSRQQPLLSKSLIKYGFKEHTIEKIEKFSAEISVANDKEMFWIRSYMSNCSKWPEMKGMNLTDGGEGCIGMKASESTRLKQSNAKKGKPAYNKGKPMPPHQVELMRQRMIGSIPWNKGKEYSFLNEEQREEKFGKHNKGNSYNKGRKHSPEIVEARRQRQTGKELVKKWKPVYQLDVQGNILKEFPSIKSASQELKVKSGAITAWCKGQRTPHFNQKWNFKYKE